MRVDVVATVVSADAVTAPVGRERAAAVYVEGLGSDGFTVVGTMIVGDLLRLRWDEGEIDILVRRATFAFTTMFDAPPPLETVPAELVPLLQRGATRFRERLVRRGDRLRFRARLEGHSAAEIRLDESLLLDESLF